MNAKLRCLLAACLGGLLAHCSTGAGAGWEYRPSDAGALRAERLARRAYDGAPPVIPHRVRAIGRENCLSCHDPGSRDNDQRVAAPRSHPAWGDCRQCHVEQRTDADFQANVFEPLWWPSSGPRLFETSPPLVPHPVQNREQCETCHIGVRAHPALRAQHGHRPNCEQCHAALVP